MSEDKESTEREEMKATVEKKLLGITHTYESIQYQIVSDVLNAISLKTIRDAMMEIMKDNPAVTEVPDMSKVLLLAAISSFIAKSIALSDTEEQIVIRSKEDQTKVKPTDNLILSNVYKANILNITAATIALINQIITISSKQTTVQEEEDESESME